MKTVPSLTKRIDLNVGYSCNLRCRFCYYLKDVKEGNRKNDLTTQECSRLIKFFREKNMEVLEFTGGEPTIRKDLFELTRYAVEVGFEKISIITNGICLANANFAKELIQAGVKDFLFSLHGSSANTHDFETGLEGSFKKLLEAIGNLLKLGVRVRCNSVATKANSADIYARAKLFRDLGVKTVNFIMYNPIEQQKNCYEEENLLAYSQAAPHFKRIIDDFGSFFNKITIRYMPLCLMTGYENYVQNVHQVHYDHDEWDYYLRSYIREPYWKWAGGLLFGLSLLPGKKKWLAYGSRHAKHAAILQAHSWLHKHKFAKCARCSYGFICAGVWKQYASNFGDAELKPKDGPLIIEPWHFMTDAQRAQGIIH